MALVKCAECSEEISDKAEACPKCGAPVKKKEKGVGCGTILFIGIAAIFVIGSLHKPTPEEQARSAERSAEFETIASGKRSVLARLKDPGSAEFGDVIYVKKPGGIAAACGSVNSKNGFGGYVGMKNFVSLGAPATTLIEGTDDKFADAWNMRCATR